MAFTNVKNRNFQSPSKFNFQIDRLRDFDFYVQSVNIPDMNISSADTGTPFSSMKIHGDHIDFSNLQVTFKLSEGMYNWYEIFSWMEALGFPYQQKQFGDLRQSKLKDLDGDAIPERGVIRDIGDLYGQASLTINTSHNNPHLMINFVDIHPISLSSVSLSTTDTEVEYLTSDVTFAYDYFTVEKVK